MNEQREEEEHFNDRLDILRHVSDIKLRLKEDITNDFVLARLGDKDKEFIIEMTGNAYFAKKLLDIMKDKGEEWRWNEKEGIYERFMIKKDEADKIKKIAKAVFDSYMIKIYMIVVLNRNVDKNYLINVLSGYLEKDEGEIEMNMDDSKLKETVKSLLADQSKGKEK